MKKHASCLRFQLSFAVTGELSNRFVPVSSDVLCALRSWFLWLLMDGIQKIAREKFYICRERKGNTNLIFGEKL